MKRVKQHHLRAAALCAFGLGAFGTAEAAIEVRADFNGDSFDDLAVGATGETIDGSKNAGAVCGPGGLTSGQGTQTWHQNVVSSGIGIADVAEPGNNFGSALAAGDFDNDGFADLAIGVPREIFGVQVGAVNIIYGSNAGLITFGNQLWRQSLIVSSPDAEEKFDNFGAALAVGDFDKDGFDDLAIGVPGEGVGDQGRSRRRPGALRRRGRAHGHGQPALAPGHRGDPRCGRIAR